MNYGMVHQHQRCVYVERQRKRDGPALEILDFFLKFFEVILDFACVRRIWYLFLAKGVVGSTAYAANRRGEANGSN